MADPNLRKSAQTQNRHQLVATKSCTVAAHSSSPLHKSMRFFSRALSSLIALIAHKAAHSFQTAKNFAQCLLVATLTLFATVALTSCKQTEMTAQSSIRVKRAIEISWQKSSAAGVHESGGGYLVQVFSDAATTQLTQSHFVDGTNLGSSSQPTLEVSLDAGTYFVQITAISKAINPLSNQAGRSAASDLVQIEVPK